MATAEEPLMRGEADPDEVPRFCRAQRGSDIRQASPYSRTNACVEEATSRVHERNDKHTCTREFLVPLPNVDLVSKDMICIPVGWWVTEEERQYIVDLIKKGW